MNEYNYTIDKWYIFDADLHGKLDAGLYLATTKDITLWFDDYASYVDKCQEINITPVDNN